MDELIQTSSVVDMIIAREGRSEAYARLMIFRAVKLGQLPVFIRKLKFGTKSINLFDPNMVEKWLETRKTYKSKKVDATA